MNRPTPVLALGLCAVLSAGARQPEPPADVHDLLWYGPFGALNPRDAWPRTR